MKIVFAATIIVNGQLEVPDDICHDDVVEFIKDSVNIEDCDLPYLCDAESIYWEETVPLPPAPLH